jgi:hypothetical protein
MSMISLIPKWSGTAKSTPVQEFLDTVEGAARVGNWSDADMVQVATLKLADRAKMFYSGCKELHDPNITWACEISSSHGSEYDVQSCLLGCTAV